MWLMYSADIVCKQNWRSIFDSKHYCKQKRKASTKSGSRSNLEFLSDDSQDQCEFSDDLEFLAETWELRSLVQFYCLNTHNLLVWWKFDKCVRLAIGEGKTKYMFSTSRGVRRIDFQITAVNYNFDAVKEFMYLGSAVTTKNDVSLGIKRIIILPTDLSRATNLIPYKTLILSALLYGMDRLTPWEYSIEKSYVRSSVQCELTMISAFGSIMSSVCSSAI